jgi:hypothetical protein
MLKRCCRSCVYYNALAELRELRSTQLLAPLHNNSVQQHACVLVPTKLDKLCV